MQGKRFCFVLGGYFEQRQGGAEYQAYLLAKRLFESGFEVHYVYVDNGREFDKKLPIELHSIHRGVLGKKLPRYGFMFEGPALLQVLREVSPDVVYQRSASAYTGIVARYAKASGKCFIWHIASEMDVTPIDANLRNVLQGRMLERAFVRWGIKNADIVIAQANYQADLLYRNYGIQATGVVANFHPVPDRVEKKCRGIVNVLWIGNLKPLKQPMVFVEMAKALHDRKDVHFYMIGRPDTKIYREVMDQSAGLRNFHYLGEISQEDVNDLMDKSHLLVNTSTVEGFPNTFIQAWLRAIPVLSLYVNPDGVLTEKRIGLCAGGVEQLIADCVTLIDDPNLRYRMGEDARTYAIKAHSVDRNVERMLEILSVWDRSKSGKHSRTGC